MRLPRRSSNAYGDFWPHTIYISYLHDRDLRQIRSDLSSPVRVSSTSPLAMSKCSQVRQGYKVCHHTMFKYKFCGGSHENTHSVRENCYNKITGPPPATERPPNHPRKCPMCLANEVGWDCCQCGKVVGRGSVSSCGTPDCAHSFCLDCDTGGN
jgi:hypothetical protein